MWIDGSPQIQNSNKDIIAKRFDQAELYGARLSWRWINIMDPEDHVKSLGILVSYFHTLEFLLRAVLKNHGKGKSKKIVYSLLKAGDTVPEDPMTNYDSLGSLIDKYNKIAPEELRIAKGIVTIRDAIGHGRVFSDTQNLPMRLFKFDKPKNGTVSVTFAATLDRNWFATTAVHLYEQIQKAMKTNEKYS